VQQKKVPQLIVTSLLILYRSSKVLIGGAKRRSLPYNCYREEEEDQDSEEIAGYQHKSHILLEARWQSK
jgi:hypothetical protein